MLSSIEPEDILNIRDWFPLTENAIFYKPELLSNGCWNSGFVEYN